MVRRMESLRMNLEDRAAIITGANRGLGKAIATAFVEAGASVLLVARDGELLRKVEGELNSLSRRPRQYVFSLARDVSCAADCRDIIRKAHEKLPGFAILVNNAGIYGPMGLIEDIDWDAWVEAIQINLFGTVLMCRAIISGFRKQG